MQRNEFLRADAGEDDQTQAVEFRCGVVAIEVRDDLGDEGLRVDLLHACDPARY